MRSNSIVVANVASVALPGRMYAGIQRWSEVQATRGTRSNRGWW